MLRTAPDLHVIPYQAVEGTDDVSFGIIAFHLAPHSRGRMRLRSRKADAAPAIDLGLLNDRGGHDARALAEAPVDLGDSRKLIAAGCPVRTALRILL